MAKPQVTRTYGPIHFEDLDPHRFEDLVRELIYDYKDWQSIEATGRSGSDEGFDVRAYERISSYYNEPNEEEFDEKVDNIHPMDGNLWMIQCKRESEIGPQKILNIITECIKLDSPPYGYILVASANFSKKSYDKFREELKKRGVMEFYLWGKAELEDMLHMPRYDRILFTFFGMSLVTKKRKRSTDVRAIIATKNKLYKIIGEETISLGVLIRDINDTHYPFENSYDDFEQKPRWKKYYFKEYSVFGLWFEIHEYYAYYDKQKKEWDYTSYSELGNLYEERDTDEERRKRMEDNSIARGYWECLPKSKQSMVSIWGLVKYEDILVIDEKGDVLNKLCHIYADFKNVNGPFSKIMHVMGKDYDMISIEKEELKRIKIFPNVIPVTTSAKIHEEKFITVDKSTLASLLKSQNIIEALYDDDGKYDFLQRDDIIQISNEDKNKEPIFIKITSKYAISIEEYLKENSGRYYPRGIIKDQIGKELNDDNVINVYEFIRTYHSAH